MDDCYWGAPAEPFIARNQETEMPAPFTLSLMASKMYDVGMHA